MEVSKRNNADKRSKVKLLLLVILMCVISFSACGQKRVYDIVADKHVKPKKLFRKGNYVTDIHLNQYAGVWTSGQYTLKTEFREKVEIDGVYRDEMTGVLMKTDKKGNEEFSLELKMNSSSQTFAYGRFSYLNRYDFFIYHKSGEKLDMKIGENEVVNVRFQNEKGVAQKLKDIHLPTEITFSKTHN